MPSYTSLRIGPEFLETYGAFSERDQRRFRQALRLLDTNEQHPSLRVHPLRGDRAGQ